MKLKLITNSNRREENRLRKEVRDQAKLLGIRASKGEENDQCR